MGCECQSILTFEVSDEVQRTRWFKANEDEINKKAFEYNEKILPVIKFYDNFGKVHKICGDGDVNEVYKMTRKCVLPQVSFMTGPTGSGKSVLGKKLCERTNMYQLKFKDWVNENSLKGQDDETVT